MQLTRYLATVMSPKIRVKSISRGGIERGQPNIFKEKYLSRTPLKRVGTEDEIKVAVVFLGTNMSKWVTGVDISVDGGWGIW